MTKKGLRFKSFPIFLLSVAYVGFIPWAPGTWGSLVSMGLPYLFKALGLNIFFQLPLFILATIFGATLCQKVQKKYDIHDPGWIVFDELLGMWLGSFFLPQITLFWVILLFVFFRFFDILKPFPVGTIDRKLTHGWGVMLDDLMAGIYASLSLLIVAKVFEYYKIFL